MLYLYTFLVALPSILFWWISIEAWLIAQSIRGAGDPLLLTLAATLGQMVTVTLLFFVGGKVLLRWKKFSQKVERFDVERFRTSGVLVCSMAAVVGVPPLSILSVVAGTLRFSFPLFVGIGIAGRIARFAALTYLPDAFKDIFAAQ